MSGGFDAVLPVVGVMFAPDQEAAAGALDEAAGMLLHDDLVEPAERHNAATGGSLTIPSASAQVLAHKV